MGLPGANAAAASECPVCLSVVYVPCLARGKVPFLSSSPERRVAVAWQTQSEYYYKWSGGSRVIPSTNCPQAAPRRPPAPALSGRVAKRSFRVAPFLFLRHGIGAAGLQFPRDRFGRRHRSDRLALALSAESLRCENFRGKRCENQVSFHPRGIHSTFFYSTTSESSAL